MKLEKPTVANVEKRAKDFFDDPKFGTNYRAIKKLFNTFPKNNSLEEVLLKATAINSLYSTQIWDIHSVAKRICSLKIDKSIHGNFAQEEIVNQIARGERYNYSFATKYCSFHNKDFYPMFDRRVERALKGYNRKKKYRFCFQRINYRNFKDFRETVLKFQEHFNLKKIALDRLDKFLWKVGNNSKN